MDPLMIIEILGGALSIAAIIGTVLMKAYVNPIQTDVDDVSEDFTEHKQLQTEVNRDVSTRLASLELGQERHETQLGTLIATCDRVCGRVDELVTVLIKRSE